MDIQSLLSEFGDFGDFFEDDVLAIGEVNILVEKDMIMKLCIQRKPQVLI